ncbi:TetR-like C-terminal domain-containing protein [Streptomyces sp. NPDC090798]|uniref:TetR-like C-terminal domain-containing protein n=1 Tax=Streptomyces sp. NPDC090798 TaxID=3365968 RepID=UPI00382F88B7
MAQQGGARRRRARRDLPRRGDPRPGRHARRTAPQRGDLPRNLDIDLLQDIWAGTILYRRLMTGSPLDTGLAEHLVQLAIDSPPLLPQ